MKLNKRIFKVVTILVSTLLMGLVVSRMHLSDRVELISGKVLKGEIVKVDAEKKVVIIRTADDSLRTIPNGQIITGEDGGPLIERGLWMVAVRAARPSGRWWLVFALFLFALPPLAGALRWKILLRMQGISMSYRQSVSLTYIGYLFNYIMLGLTGGDVVKAYYVSRQTHRKTEAVMSVFMDRVVGLIALTTLGLIVILSKLSDPRFVDVVLPVQAFAVLGLFGVLVVLSRKLRRHLPQTMVLVATVGGSAIFASRVILRGFASVRSEVLIFATIIVVCAVVVFSPVRRLLRWNALKNKLAESKLVREVDASFHVYRGHPLVLAGLFLFSMLMHTTNIIAVYACGRSLNIDLELDSYLLLVPVIVLVSSIPISVAGLGVQETMFPFFFGLPGVGVPANEAGMLAFMFRFCSSFLWVIPGYVFLLLWRDRPTVAAVAEDAAADEPETVAD